MNEKVAINLPETYIAPEHLPCPKEESSIELTNHHFSEWELLVSGRENNNTFLRAFFFLIKT